MPIAPALPGGTGETFDWELLRGRRSRVPLILAGGLVPDNVGEAIEAARPFAVDVASGVESAPGIKDHELMTEFAARATRPAGRTSEARAEPEHFTESRERDEERRARSARRPSA